MTYDLTYMSFGGGLQSTCMLAMANAGMIECDLAVFADTGAEPPWVYELVETAKALSDIPVHTVMERGGLYEDVMRTDDGRYATMPLWCRGADGREAPLRRQCTSEFKILPIEQHIRKFMGYKKGQRVKKKVRAAIGISTDEGIRMKDSRTPWMTNWYPLVEMGMNRSACATMLRDLNWPVARKSSCSFCPYHGDDTFKDIRDNYPEEWKRVVKLDKQVRNMMRAGGKQPCYVHRSLKPIDEVDFDSQPDLFEYECEGGCFL